MSNLSVSDLQALQTQILGLVDNRRTKYEIECLLKITLADIFAEDASFLELYKEHRVAAKLKVLDVLWDNIDNPKFNFMSFKMYCQSRGISLQLVQSLEDEDADAEIAYTVARTKDVISSSKAKERLFDEDNIEDKVFVIKDFRDERKAQND